MQHLNYRQCSWLARAHTLALLLICLFACASCSGGRAAQVAAQAPAGQGVKVAEAAEVTLGNVQPLDQRAVSLFTAAHKQGSQLGPNLPCPILAWPRPEHGVSALEVEFLGKDTFAASLLAAVSGNNLVLDSSQEDLAWAIYEVPGVAAPATIDAIEVQVAAFSPAGGDPGYYIGVANYALGAWELAGHADTSTWTGALPATAPYRGLGGRAFIYVLTHGGQAVTVNQVTVTLGTEGWSETVVDATGNTGWFPAAAFLDNGNPVVVYASQADGRPRIAVGDRAAGLASPANWSVTVIDPMSDAQVSGTGAAYLDVVISPLGLPRVAMSYLGVDGLGAEENSIACFSVLTQDGPELNWLNFRFGDQVTGNGYLDGAGFSSVDYNPITNDYVSATYLRNANAAPTEPEHDMLVRLLYFNDADPRAGLTSETIRRFALPGTYWLFPHLRVSPDDGKISVCVGGAKVYQQGETLEDWSNIYFEAYSTAWGSLAYNPEAERFSLSYCLTLPEGIGPITRLEATFVPEITNPSSLPQMVDGVDRTAAEEGLALCSELAYAPNGTPCLAYTSFDGTATYIRFARFDGTTWQIEELPFTPSTPSDTSSQVLLDLTVDTVGVPLIAYTYLNGSAAELHVAVRSE